MDRDEDNDMVRQGTHIELQSLEPEVTTCAEGEKPAVLICRSHSHKGLTK